MTNQQGAPATWLTDPAPTPEREFAEWLNERRGFPVSAVFHEIMDRFAALVEAQQPAPSAAAAVGQEPNFNLLRKALADRRFRGETDLQDLVNMAANIIAEDGAILRARQTIIEQLKAAAQPSPTPQADSQPAPVRDDDGYWGGGAPTKYAARAPADSVTAPAGGVVGIYVASRASLPERPAYWRALRAAGWPIVSTWIDEAGPGETADLRELWARIIREISSARGLVLHVETDDFPLKGALIEVGAALSLGKRVGVYAPGVVLEDRSMRPLGSWAAHPLVRLCPTLADAREWAESMPTPPAQAADSVLEDAARLEALHAAVTAIYLDDSSDFKSALGAVVRHLDPKLAGELLAWPKRAFDISMARVDAARKQGGA